MHEPGSGGPSRPSSSVPAGASGQPGDSDDSFAVTIDNQTSELLDVGTSTFNHGGFVSGTTAVSVPPGSSTLAFSVDAGAFVGPQGTITYLVDDVTQLAILFNSNFDGIRGAYFYAALQPRVTGADPTSYYTQVAEFSPFTGTSTFTPTITLSLTAGGVTVTPMTAVSEPGNVMINAYVTNNTPGIMTLEDVTQPLNRNWQPALAQTIAPFTTALLMTTFYEVKTSLGEGLNVAYNLPGGVVATLVMPANDNAPSGPIEATFSGKVALSTYSAPPVMTTTQSGDYTSITYALALVLGLPFVVTIENQTSFEVTGTSSSFTDGGLVPGTTLGTIPFGQTGDAFQAVGTVVPAGGVTGSVVFTIGSSLTLTVQCQAVAGGGAGWYFYPGLTATDGADPTSVLVQVVGMPPPFQGQLQASFQPTLMISAASDNPSITPLQAVGIPAGVTASVINIEMENQTGSPMTLSTVTSPLDVTWQPTFAPVIANGTTALLMTVALVDAVLDEKIEATYNLGGGVQVQLSVVASGTSAPNAPVTVVFLSGQSSFTSAQPTSSTLGDVTTYTLAVSLGSAGGSPP